MTDLPDDGVGTQVCPACRQTVPCAPFCGNCGADPAAPVTPWRVLLRPGVYATAHREPVWMPRVSSTYLPRLNRERRKPFRIGMIMVLVAIVVLAALRVNGPLGVTATAGWPLIFMLYVWQSEGFRDIPKRILATAMVLGIVLGSAWWLLAGRWLAHSYGISTGSGLMLTQVLNIGFLVTLGGAVLMVLPAILTRFLPVPVRESLDGFVVGTFGALWYQMAATTTVVAPQFSEGLLDEQSAGRMFQDAVAYGVVNPLTTTAAGGLAGLALWFTADPGRQPWRARIGLIVCALLGFGLYLGAWAIESTSLASVTDLAAKLTIAALAVLVVRCAVQIALLHEAPDPAGGDPILCVHCERVVPDMPFCAACGAAARASSRSSRRRRHDRPPVQVFAA